MTSSIFIRRLRKPLICMGLISISADLNAQVSLAQIIDNIESYKNFSYLSTTRKMEVFTIDTITELHNTFFIKAPEDKNFGYLFNAKALNEKNKLTYTDIYNGQNLIHITPADSTYEMQKESAFDMNGTLPGCLKWIQGRLEIKSSTIVKTSDTTIHAMDSYHLIVDVYDTIIDKEHNYTYVDLCIDKLSGLPDCIIIKSRYSAFGDGITNYYSETRYFDYRFNQSPIDMASMSIPVGFHEHKEQPVLPKEQTDLLTSGSVAPDWTLYDADGKMMSLTQMKGKVVLLDFFFIGCGGCMTSLKPLNKLHEKYKSQNIEIVSMTFRDNTKSVLSFEKNYNIKYPIYINAADIVKSYHVTGFPTFYFIDKEGKIANVFVGYEENFEEKTTSIINNLLND